jgi:streptogramin lyase
VPVAAFGDRKVADLEQTADGRLWVVVDGDGVFELQPGEPPEEATHHLAGFNVRSVMLDSQGRVWFGLCGRGVALVDVDGKRREFLEQEKSPFLHLLQDRGGDIWAGTSSGGLYQYDGTNWTRHLAGQGAISLLHCDRQGRIWTSTQSQGGLRYWSGGEWHVSLDTRLPMTCMAPHGDALWAGGVVDGVHVLEDATGASQRNGKSGNR